jgi:hypothetical protein
MAGGERPDPHSPSRESTSGTHRLTVPEPDDIGLPRARRSYVLPISIAIAVFALLILARLVWG